MRNSKFYSLILLAFVLLFSNCKKQIQMLSVSSKVTSSLTENSSTASTSYTMPHEGVTHEGTWLQFPHEYEYGFKYRNDLIDTWVAMTKELVAVEKVHIIAYNLSHKNWIISKLNAAGVSLANVDFKLFQTNDVWVRDNGPIYVRNAAGSQKIEDWGFNGWGGKFRSGKCDLIPGKVGTSTGVPVVNLNSTMIVEGGAVEVDGNGTLLATRSSILNSNRNPGMTQAKAEAIFTINLGVTDFIWLDGVKGKDITDQHIDGFARFANANTIVTMNSTDLKYWYLSQADINTLYAAKNAVGTPYNIIYLPLTKNNVKTTSGKNLGEKGSYVNFYEANGKVLMPAYNDPNDTVAKNILQGVYPNKTVVLIDVRNLYENGGMVHCVTQQQPL